MNKSLERQSILRPILIIAGIVIILAAFKVAASILSMFFLAAFLAMLFAPPFSWLRNKGVASWLAVLIVFGVIMGSTLLLFGLAWIPLSQMHEKLPAYQTNLSTQISAVRNLLDRFGVDVSTLESQGFLDIGLVFRILREAIQRVSNAMFVLMVVVMTSIFVTLEASSYPERLRSGLGVNNSVIDRYRLFSRRLNSYMLARIKLNLVFAVAVTLLLLILGVDFPVFWGVVAFFTGFIPVVGLVIAIAPPAVLAFLESGWLWAAMVLAGYTIINLAVDNILQPRIMGQDLGLSPVVVFLALFFWSFFFGGIGMLIAMPLTMLTVILFGQYEETRWLAVLMSTGGSPQTIAATDTETEELLQTTDDT